MSIFYTAVLFVCALLGAIIGFILGRDSVKVESARQLRKDRKFDHENEGDW